METTITKKVKGSTMEKIFDKSEILSVRYFECLDLVSEEKFDPDTAYKYQIRIRHAEGSSATELFKKEINRIKNEDRATT